MSDAQDHGMQVAWVTRRHVDVDVDLALMRRAARDYTKLHLVNGRVSISFASGGTILLRASSAAFRGYLVDQAYIHCDMATASALNELSPCLSTLVAREGVPKLAIYYTDRKLVA